MRAQMSALSGPQSSAKFCLSAPHMKKGGLTAGMPDKKGGLTAALLR
jgi:hypothetical protein